MNRRQFLLGSAAAALAAQTPAKKPNFIFILADDLGYGDIGCYGARGFATPNIDRMAEEGMRLTSYYSPACVCSPTRSALMTGCYPARVSMGFRVLYPYSVHGLHPDEITVAEVLKAAGYATACIGKWHLGRQQRFLPTHQGFDSYFGIPYSNDMGNANYAQISFKSPPTPLMRGDDVVESDPDQRFLTRRYTEEAVQFLRSNRDKPFFLYLAHAMPHMPIAVSEKFAGHSKQGKYGDVVEELDWSTGEILTELRNLGLDGNTLVLFTSDNGAVVFDQAMTQKRGYVGGSSGPLRGAKATTWDGGNRVPMIARWPGRVPAGKTCSELATGMDILPTLAHLGGGRVPDDRIIDGKNIWPLLSGVPGAKTLYEVFYYYSDLNELAAVRSGKWKLHLFVPARYPGPGMTAPLLYDLEADIGEKNNIAAAHPDVVARLMKLADAARADLGDFRQRRVGANVRTAGWLP